MLLFCEKFENYDLIATREESDGFSDEKTEEG